MYKCPDCGEIFEEPKVVKEFHGLQGPYHELFAYCPFCDGDAFYEIEEEEEDGEE